MKLEPPGGCTLALEVAAKHLGASEDGFLQNIDICRRSRRRAKLLRHFAEDAFFRCRP